MILQSNMIYNLAMKYFFSKAGKMGRGEYRKEKGRQRKENEGGKNPGHC